MREYVIAKCDKNLNVLERVQVFGAIDDEHALEKLRDAYQEGELNEDDGEHYELVLDGAIIAYCPKLDNNGPSYTPFPKIGLVY